MCVIEHRGEGLQEAEEAAEQGDVADDPMGEEAAAVCTKDTQTDVSGQDMASLTHQLNELKLQNAKLISRLDPHTPEHFKDPEKVKYFTGLQTHHILMSLLEYVQPALVKHGPGCLPPFKKLLICLMRLRLNMPIEMLAHTFQVSPATLSRAYTAGIDVLYVYLKRMIIWPDRELLRETMPRCFRTHFGLSVTVVIDCFEIFTERPSDLHARALTYSNYKHHHTAKYLIGITPCGVISFISQGWGGRVSDKYLTEHCGFLDKLQPGDVVLADRGFNIADSVASVMASVVLPAFTKGKKQLSPQDIEKTRKIANVRIHVERVIGQLKQKYTYLDRVMPVDNLIAPEGDIPTLDKEVTICCGLINLCKSVVPFD